LQICIVNLELLLHPLTRSEPLSLSWRVGLMYRGLDDHPLGGRSVGIGKRYLVTLRNVFGRLVG
jgi:hypothetical protein